ncbi:MAG: thiolase family protein [Chloroflexota bacterium]
MRDVVILGVGMTNFGRFPEKTMAQLMAEAMVYSLKDAGVSWKDIPAMYCAHSIGGMVDGQLAEAQIGHIGIPIINMSNMCAGGNSTVVLGCQAVATGIYDMIAIVGGDKVQAAHGPVGGGGPPRPQGIMGATTMLSKYAMKTQRAIYERRYTLDQIAWASVKNHNNACLNPRAQYKIPMKGPQDVHNARMVCDPMTLYHCCPTTDGAAAIILCTRAVARKYARPPFITVAGGAITSQRYIKGEDADTRDVTERAAKRAYEMAGIDPEDVDVVELHDNFAVSELEHIADLLLCRDNEVGPMMERGDFNIDGKIAVNPSGGLLGKGHPTGGTGIAHMCEFTWQLRGQAGQRQTKDPKVAVSQMAGGDEGMAACVAVVKK